MTLAIKIENYIANWMEKKSSLGFVLIAMVIVAMAWANSPFSHTYFELLETTFTIGFENAKLEGTLHQWINDGLMAHFFFLVGLEIKKEVINGELSTFRKASLPILAALGGMVFPALIFLAFNSTGDASNGWGIPMATDIAFALGLISLVSSRVTESLRTFLTALATADDIGAILVIAIFLSPNIEFQSLGVGAFYFGILLIGNFIGIRSPWFYGIIGVLGLWIAILFSGIHATLAGVLAAMTIPVKTKLTEGQYREELKVTAEAFESSCADDSSLLSGKQVGIIEKIIDNSEAAVPPLQHLKKRLEKFINFGILPLFALANAGVLLEGDIIAMITHPICIGIIVGLVVGKLLGIFTFSRVAVLFKVADLPAGSNWKKMAGLGLMGGIGFTMSLFIAELAITDEFLLQRAKIGVLIGSLVSALLGLLWLTLGTRKIKS